MSYNNFFASCVFAFIVLPVHFLLFQDFSALQLLKSKKPISKTTISKTTISKVNSAHLTSVSHEDIHNSHLKYSQKIIKNTLPISITKKSFSEICLWILHGKEPKITQSKSMEMILEGFFQP